MGHLVFRRRGLFLMLVELGLEPLTVGRDGAEVAVDAPGCAPVQAAVSLEGQSCRLVDRSGERTRVNGKAVEEALIGEGAVIAFGDCEATFLLSLPWSCCRGKARRARRPRSSTYNVPCRASCAWSRRFPATRARAARSRSRASSPIGSAVAVEDLRLDSDKVSARHARLSRQGMLLMLHDLKSTNGTWVEAGRVYELALKLGARFQAGPYDVWAEEPPARGHAPQPVIKEQWLGKGMVSVDPAMHKVFAEVRRLAPLTIPVRIDGETGTGKELIARALHEQSNRASGPWVTQNCASLDGDTLELKLFGHVKGAYTGAISSHLGKFQMADGGTLFLDEVAEMPPEAQRKLLRVLETSEVEPLGSDHCVRVDVRIVVASHRHLPLEVAEGRFREDLFYRLAGMVVELPPLRLRPRDVMPIWRYLLEKHCPRDAPKTSPAAAEKLMAHPWPGNVRELGWVLECTLSHALGEQVIEPEHIVFVEVPRAGRAPGNLIDTLGKTYEQIERAVFEAAIRAAKGNRSEAARQLDLHRQTLIKKLKDYGLERVGLDEGEAGE